MKEAIQKAMDFGYWPEKLFNKFKWDDHGATQTYKIDPRKCVLDFEFWKALGKACGWTKNDMDNHVSVFDCEYTSDCALCNSIRFHEINLTEGWDKADEYIKKIIKKP